MCALRYGGIFERGSREYTLDDFYSLQLDKMDRFICLKASDVVVPTAGEEESSSSSDEDDDEDSDDDSSDDHDEKTLLDACEEAPETLVEDLGDVSRPGCVQFPSPKPLDKESLRLKAKEFMGVSKDTARSAEDVISTPLPGETLAMFYARSREPSFSCRRRFDRDIHISRGALGAKGARNK